jgi:hypothetical protein
MDVGTMDQDLQKEQPAQAAGKDAEGGIDNRRHKRRSVLWPAHIRVGKHELACQIWNLSLGGARVRVDLPIQDGVEVDLILKDRGEIPATVVWAKGGVLGVAFSVGTGVIRQMFKVRLHILGLDDED